MPAEVEGRRSRRQPAALPPLAVGERFAELGAVFGLSQLELDVLLVAAAPDVDERIEVLYGYANDDLTRRRATPGLVGAVCGVGLDDARLHRALGGDGPLLVGGLLVIDDAALPLPSRTLRCPDWVVRWLVGIEEASPPLARLLVHPPSTDNEEAQRIGTAISAGAMLHFLRSPPGSDPRGVAVAAGDVAGAATLVVDLDRLAPRDDLDEVVTGALREAQLRRAVLVAGPIERIFDGGGSVERWVESRWPTVLYRNRSWDPKWSLHPPLLRMAPPVRASAQLALWKELLGSHALSDEELTQVVASFRLTGEQVMLATGAALAEAAAEGRVVTAHDVRRTALGRNASSLGRLARRIRPKARWADLVLPALTIAQLREFVDRAQHRELAHETCG